MMMQLLKACVPLWCIFATWKWFLLSVNWILMATFWKLLSLNYKNVDEWHTAVIVWSLRFFRYVKDRYSSRQQISVFQPRRQPCQMWSFPTLEASSWTSLTKCSWVMKFPLTSMCWTTASVRSSVNISRWWTCVSFLDLRLFLSGNCCIYKMP